MTNDDELGRRLEEHLAAHAERLPDHVRDAVFEEIPRRQQTGTGFGWMARGGRLIVATAAVMAAILVLVIGPPLLDRFRSGPGAGASASASPTASPTFVWDAVLNFRGSPIQTNPSMDGYGNQAVWSYLRGPAGVHDPSSYVRFTEFDGASRDSWIDGRYPGLAVGATPGDDTLTLQPWGAGSTDGQAAIVAWRSPVDVTVDVHPLVEVDAACGDGVGVWLDRGGATVEAFHLGRGVRTVDLRLAVARGDTLYLGVDPGAAGVDRCDATWLQLTITG